MSYLRLFSTCLFWFVVRANLETYSAAPAFSQTPYGFGDSIMLALGILGIVSIVIDIWKH